MKRRTVVIYLFSLNAMLIALGVALVTLLLTSAGSASELTSACAEDGASADSSALLPVSRGFESIPEAETFICHQIVYPRKTEGWSIENISASRSRPPADIVRGVGFASVTLDYARLQGSGDLRVEVSPFRISSIDYGIVDRVEIMGAEAKVIQGKDHSWVYLQWEARGYSFYTEAHLTDDFGLADLYAILRSIK
jgi:hypothetical protein